MKSTLKPYGPGRCPECGAKLSITTPGETTSDTLPGVSCTVCNYGEIYYPEVEA